ncbi:hypothetical protein BJX99DRAFT_230706 [Aspergillus californicus]
MSTEPLLPSYTSATSGHGHEQVKDFTIAATPARRTAALFSISTVILSTKWAWRSYTTADLTPPASAPLLPYFAILCLSISFGWWIGYAILAFCDVVNGPKLQHRVIIWTSVVVKVALAGIHAGVSFWYQAFFHDSVQPNWVLVFLAAQAWWDLLLLGFCYSDVCGFLRACGIWLTA